MKHDNRYIRAKSLAMTAAALLLAACHIEPSPFTDRYGDPIIFDASVYDVAEVQARTRGIEGLDSVYIKPTLYDVDFFIQLCSKESDGSIFTDTATYIIPSGYEGRLEPKDAGHALNWHSLNTPHTFYAWTIPWDEDWGQSISTKPLRVEFQNSAEKDGYDKYHNHAILEKFIGAKSDSYSYDKYGKYVGLTFYHLVSKINIGSFVLLESSGAIQENLKADITFIGMPTAATFYPHPSDGGRPRVDKQWESSKDSGVTFYIDNTPSNDIEDIFYICPEVDFSEVDFKIKLNSQSYADYDTYYGTFDDVKFVRKPGTAYDKGDDDKILHAGEMMTLHIQLIPGIGPGLSVVIDKWSTDDPHQSNYHTHPGIYSNAELSEVLDAFVNQKQYRPTPENIEWLYDMYGTDGENDEKYFTIYENVTTNSNIFPIPEGYILDGMGHTITMKSNNGSVFGHKYFNIGPVIDVWITDGVDTIYIDRDGYVWVYNEANELVNSNNRLTPLEKTNDERTDKKSYDISCKTGEAHQSSYYNGNITGTGN